MALSDELALAHDDFARFGVHHILRGHPAPEAEFPRIVPPVLVAVDGPGVLRAAILRGHDDVLHHVHQPAGEVTRVRGAQRGVGQALPGAVGGDEVFQDAQALPETGANGHGHDAARRVGHHAPHARQLVHRTITTLGGTRHGHQGQVTGGVQGVLHGLPHFLGGLLPDFDDMFGAFLLREQAPAEGPFHLLDLGLSLGQNVRLRGRRGNVIDGQGHPGTGGVLEAQVLDGVGHLDRDLRAADFVNQAHDVLDAALVHGPVDEAGELRQDLIEEHPPHRGLEDPGLGLLQPVALVVVPGLGAEVNLGMDVHMPQTIGRFHLVVIAEDHTIALVGLGVLHRQVVNAQNHVLGRRDNGLAVRGLEQVLGGKHEFPGFLHRLIREGQVHGHLVAVEVRVEGRTDQRVQLDGQALDEHRLEGLDAQAVQGGRAVQEHRALLHHLVQHLPHLGSLAVHQFLGVLDVGGITLANERGHDEGPVEFQGHGLGQTALVQLELRPHHDDGTARVVHPLAQQVAAEAALLALEHVAQGLELPPAPAGEGLAPVGVVNQGIHRFLEHALLVADDDVRRAQFQKPLEAVVPVDDPQVEVVQVTGGEATAVQLHHRAQFRRQHGEHFQNHPLGTVARTAQPFHHLEAPNGLLALLLALGGLDFLPQVLGQGVQIQPTQNFLEGLRAHVRTEHVPPAGLEFPVAGLAQEGKHPQFHEFVPQAHLFVVHLGRFLFQLLTQGFHLGLGFLSDAPHLLFDGLQFARAFRVDLFLDALQVFPHDVLDAGDVLVFHHFARGDHHGARGAEEHGLGYPLAQLVLEHLLQPLAFFHDGLQHGSDAFVVSRFDFLALLFQGLEALVPLGLDHGDAGVDLLRQVVDALADFRVEPFQGPLTGFFVHIGHHILGEVQHPFQVPPVDVQQETQIGGHPTGIP